MPYDAEDSEHWWWAAARLSRFGGRSDGCQEVRKPCRSSALVGGRERRDEPLPVKRLLPDLEPSPTSAMTTKGRGYPAVPVRIARPGGRSWVLVALLLAVSVVGSAGSVAADAGFADLDEAGPHRVGVEDLAELGVLEGTDCAPGQFCPSDPLERWVMAVWLVRVLDGENPGSSATRFADVDPDEWWAPYVERLAVLGVTAGCDTDPVRYCPDDSVTRAQMATFLTRAFDLDAGPPFGFVDIEGNAHTPSINALAAAGVTAGCGTGPVRYCPDDSVTRAQMATFLTRAMNRAALSVEIESPTSRTVSAPFVVGITFSRQMNAFGVADVEVVNGRATRLTGSGSEYEITVVPAAEGSVVVWIPEAIAHDGAGSPNKPSPRLVRTYTTAQQRDRPGLDIWDRAAVLAAHSKEFERVEPEWGYTGDVTECVAGTTSKEFRDSVVQRVNWYRHMAGLDPVTENPALSATAQEKALIMLAEGRLSHFPTSDWACYRTIDLPGGENLSLGVAGVGGVDGYMQDAGDHNLAVGHRIQILSPLVTEIGTGNVRSSGRFGAANAMHLGYDWDLDPTVREERGFVAWPPAGYVPADVVWGRWSFSKQWIATEVTRSGNVTYTRLFLTQPDFSRATVTVTDHDGPVETEIIHRDTALVWAMHGDTNSALLPEPTDGDHCYTLTISNVEEDDGAVQAPYQYAVCVASPDR